MASAAADLLIKHLRVVLDPARPETDNDGQLLARWATDRDANAFGAVVWRHGPMVWRVAHGVLHQTQDAEDVFRAAFLVLARKAAALQRRSSVAGWLYQTAHRLALKTRTTMVRLLRRQRATVQLEKFADDDEAWLRQAQQHAVSLESRQRLGQILERLVPQKLRLLRTLEVLERVGTPSARQFLQTLATQPEGSDLSREAAASLKRLTGIAGR
jgi:RNA polymerase sigma factor (sigma-70 family)